MRGVRIGRSNRRPFMGGALRLLFVVAAALCSFASTARAEEIVVNTLLSVQNPVDGLCSLQEAVQVANSNSALGGGAGECKAGNDATPLSAGGVGDRIVFPGLSGTISLTGTGPGQVENIGEALEIDGRTGLGYVPFQPAITLEMTDGNRAVLRTSTSGNSRNVQIYGLGITSNGNGAEGILLRGDDLRVEENVVYGMPKDGIVVDAGSAANLPSEIINNWIGLEPGGKPNGNGILTGGHGLEVRSPATTITIEGNVIAASGEIGLRIAGGDNSVSEAHLVHNNMIGTDPTGRSCLFQDLFSYGNRGRGIELDNGTRGVTVSGNVVGCNGLLPPANDTGDGIALTGGFNGTLNVVDGNWVGTSPQGDVLGNGHNGIEILSSANNNRVSNNVVAYNGVIAGADDCEQAGIHVRKVATEQNELTRNSIYDNVGLAIDLAVTGSCGVTANDDGDADTGPNAFNNFPNLDPGPFEIVDGQVTITGDFNGAPSAHRLEFFCNPTVDASGFGEAKDFIGERTIAGRGAFSAGPFAVPADCNYVTATATELTLKNSSEVSAAVATARVCEDTMTGSGLDQGCAPGATECNDDTPLFEKCVVCQDDSVGGVDGGCSMSTPACDESGQTPACVECVVMADCPPSAQACSQNQCVICIDSGTGSTLDAGCSGATPECDDSDIENVSCVACQDDAPTGEIDGGCLVATPACDESGATPVCVECLDDGDCGVGAVCNAMSKTCERCVDSNSGAGVDSGCSEPTSECDDTAPGGGACVVCEDDAAAGQIDGGCAVGAPACNTASGMPVCVECLADADCPGASVCDEDLKSCVACVDGGTGVMDPGCAALPGSGNANACSGSGASASCVECTGDADCDANEVCDPVLNACVSCLDTTTGEGPDHGCSEPSSECRTDNAGGEICVVCEDDAPGGGIDGGCNASARACDESAFVPVCVECLVDADCVEGGYCNTDTNTCVSCLDDATGSAADTGCAEPASECDSDVLGSEACVVCQNDAASGQTDGGCDASAPICDESGVAPVCVGCLVDGDCTGGDICDQLLNICAPCVDQGEGAADRGCAAGAGSESLNACVGNGAAARCVACTDNADCNVGDVCNPNSNTCEVPCTDSAVGAGVDAQCSEPTSECDDSVLGREICVVCEDDAGNGEIDGGCSGAQPICDVSGATPVCVGCLGDDDCDGAEECTAQQVCEVPKDSDGDGVRNSLDPDDDNDGILDSDEGGDENRDSDGDGVPDREDLDSDNDGIPDLWENGSADLDANGDGRLTSADAAFGDQDGDGLLTPFDGDDADPENQSTGLPLDADLDDVPNAMDLDSDGDGICDVVEAAADVRAADTDEDCRLDTFIDDDEDGLSDDLQDAVISVSNADDDSEPDYLDTDSDDDTIIDAIEGHDADGDGMSDTAPSGNDFDNDGLDDAYDDSQGGRVAPVQDSDADDIADFRDPDDDGDGIPTRDEAGDADNDGIVDYLQSAGGSGNGGGGCGVSTAHRQPTPLVWLAVGLALMLGARRRRM